MRQSFDRKVPVWKQRLLVALAKSVRNQGKKHGTGKRSAAKRREMRARRVASQAAQKKRLSKMRMAAKAYLSGETDQLALTPDTSSRNTGASARVEQRCSTSATDNTL